MKKMMISSVTIATLLFGNSFDNRSSLGSNRVERTSSPDAVVCAYNTPSNGVSTNLLLHSSNSLQENLFASTSNSTATNTKRSSRIEAVENVDDADLILSLSGHTESVSSISFSRDGKYLASGSWDNTVKVWDVNTGKVLFDLKGHSAGVSAVAFSPSSLMLASVSLDSTLRVWEIRKEAANSTNASSSSQLSNPSSKTQFASSNATNSLTEGVLKAYPAYSIKAHPNWISAVAFSNNGQFIATGGWDNQVKLWDAQTGKLVQTFKGHMSAILDLKFTNDGKTLISSSRDESIIFWNLRNGEITYKITGHSGWITSIALNEKNTLLASGGSDETVSLWDIASQPDSAIELRRFPGHKDYVRSIAFAPDGKILASGGDDRTLKFWNVETGREIYEIEGHASWVRSIAYSPNGKIIATAGDDKLIKLWNAEKPIEVAAQNAEVVKKVAVSEARQARLEQEALLKRKCNRCHTFKAVEQAFTRENLSSTVERMRNMPNSGITKQEAYEIIRYLRKVVK
ncbi:WD-40 repeat protein [Chloroherpeton thalassium ATCC 35110]|uniref:WD-40 repeat protein n=1 Tax=Chloroherpeton thalassium (strain ATCC 35110 / GB-78) TaxID=517418 RepID=B3QYS2_CHLT3|nr:photosystem P840 reaction-center cytochrome c-551 [Chloroherpeton thalassium]ACF15145.1 WD-40 repeat protein [Chloroherpeton thalassium ATCC 35110]